MFTLLFSLLLALLAHPVPAAGAPAAAGYAAAVKGAVVPAPAQRSAIDDEQSGRAPAVVPVVPIHPPTVAAPTDPLAAPGIYCPAPGDGSPMMTDDPHCQ